MPPPTKPFQVTKMNFPTTNIKLPKLDNVFASQVLWRNSRPPFVARNHTSAERPGPPYNTHTKRRDIHPPNEQRLPGKDSAREFHIFVARLVEGASVAKLCKYQRSKRRACTRSRSIAFVTIAVEPRRCCLWTGRKVARAWVEREEGKWASRDIRAPRCAESIAAIRDPARVLRQPSSFSISSAPAP